MVKEMTLQPKRNDEGLTKMTLILILFVGNFYGEYQNVLGNVV